MDLQRLEDAALLARLKELVRREREDIADIVAHLAEVESRDLALRLAFPSLFAYCVRELGYTEAAAYYRIRAARAARLYPQVLDMLKSGTISLEAIVRLHPHLNGPEGARLLKSAEGKSTRQVESMIAALAPLPDKPDMARVISVQRETREAPQATMDPLFPPAAAKPVEEPAPQPSAPPPEVKRVQFVFTADEDTLLLLRRAQEVLRHKYPAGRFEDIFRDALIALLEKRDLNVRLLGKLPKGVAVRQHAGGRARITAERNRNHGNA